MRKGTIPDGVAMALFSLTKECPDGPHVPVDDIRRATITMKKAVPPGVRRFYIVEVHGCSAEDADAYRAELKPDSVPMYVNGVFTFREDDMPELN